MSISNQSYDFYVTATKNPSISSKEDLERSIAIDPVLQFSYENVSYDNYQAKSVPVNTKTYLQRKVVAIPAALYAGVVKSIYHLATAIFKGTYYVCKGDSRHFKLNLNSVAQDLRESLGWLVTLFISERRGSYMVENSLFQKDCYSFYGSLGEVAKAGYKIETLISQALNAKGNNLMAERKNHLEEAFQTLKKLATADGSLPAALRPQLYQVLYQYANDVRYAQDGAEGFRDCAALMKLSLCLQLVDLRLSKMIDLKWLGKDVDLKWNTAQSITDLISKTQPEDDSNIKPYDIGLEQLGLKIFLGKLREEPKFHQMLTDTLVKLAYSSQNIPEYQQPSLSNTLRHQYFQEITETVIGKDSETQKKAFADFLYNRCSFMVKLQHENPQSDECLQAQIESYNPVQDLFKEIYGVDSPAYLAKLSQIENMRGLLSLRMKKTEAVFDQVKEHFYNAVDLRMRVPEPSGIEERWIHQHLLNNVRTGLIEVLITEGTEESIKEAIPHAIEMAKFVISSQKEGRSHCYNPSYLRALLRVIPFFSQIPPESTPLFTQAFQAIKQMSEQ